MGCHDPARVLRRQEARRVCYYGSAQAWSHVVYMCLMGLNGHCRCCGPWDIVRLEAEVVGSLQAPLEKVRGDVNAKKNNRVRWLRIGQRHDDQGVTFFSLQLSSRRFNHHQLGTDRLPYRVLARLFKGNLQKLA